MTVFGGSLIDERLEKNTRLVAQQSISKKYLIRFHQKKNFKLLCFKSND